ncbi:GAG-pre-integrase domain [Popillia japonica]|uniref:GAG-pre-integrase domain n=1 Tax=Popillia japonica TaxID=7064 RepID=A0AAW1IFF0_POPJA
MSRSKQSSFKNNSSYNRHFNQRGVQGQQSKAAEHHENRSKEVQKCFKCNKPGHIQRYCRSTLNSQRGFSRNSYGSHARRTAENVVVNDAEKNSFNVNVMATTKEVQEEDEAETEEIKWLLDSGCSDHIITSDKYFCKSVKLKNPVSIKVGDGFGLESDRIGTINVYFSVENQLIETEIKNVYYVKNMNQNLLSVSSIVKQNNSIVFKNNYANIYNCNEKVIAIAVLKNKLFELIGKVVNKDNVANSYVSYTEMSKKEKWHRILGHTNFQDLKCLCKSQLLNGLPTQIEDEFLKCEICIKNKTVFRNRHRTQSEKYALKESKNFETPMEVNLKIEPSENVEENLKYRNLIGALLYIANRTRPDISYSVNYLSRYQNKYSDTHYKYALRILKYLYGTRTIKLIYNSESEEVMDAYVDADWAADTVDRKSTTGILIRIFGNTILWKSQKQKIVSRASTHAEYYALANCVEEIRASTHAEYYALANCVEEIIPIQGILEELGITFNSPVKVYQGNSGAITLGKNGKFSKNSKHIDVSYHFVHDYERKKLIDVQKIHTNDQVADILTKSLGKIRFQKFRILLGLRSDAFLC